MAVSIDWSTFVITVPKADMTLIQASPEIRELDLDWLRLQLKALEAGVEGIVFDDTHIHNTEVTLGTVTYARVIEVISPYTIEFEDGAYLVDLVGANSNVGDPSIRVVNQVSANSNNSAGLVNNAAGVASSVWSNDDGLRVRYDGVVHIDTSSPNVGTTAPVGTNEFPVNNVADAQSIATALGIRQFNVRGSITLTASRSDWVFQGEGEEAEINLNGQDVADSEFRNLVVTGSVGTGPIQARDCELDGLTGVSGTFIDCSLRSGTHEIAGPTRFVRSTSAVAGPGQPNVSFNGVSTSLEFRGHIGGLRISDMTALGSTLSVDANPATVVIDASCTTGSAIIRGGGNLSRLDSMGGAIDDAGFKDVGGEGAVG